MCWAVTSEIGPVAESSSSSHSDFMGFLLADLGFRNQGDWEPVTKFHLNVNGDGERGAAPHRMRQCQNAGRSLTF